MLINCGTESAITTQSSMYLGNGFLADGPLLKTLNTGEKGGCCTKSKVDSLELAHNPMQGKVKERSQLQID